MPYMSGKQATMVMACWCPVRISQQALRQRSLNGVGELGLLAQVSESLEAAKQALCMSE